MTWHWFGGVRATVDRFDAALVRGYEIERISAFDVVGYACLT
ncbi:MULTISPECIES: hypothetical protein [Rhizobium]|nr:MULTISPECIES: hypothetical protein [Rhizobium]